MNRTRLGSTLALTMAAAVGAMPAPLMAGWHGDIWHGSAKRGARRHRSRWNYHR